MTNRLDSRLAQLERKRSQPGGGPRVICLAGPDDVPVAQWSADDPKAGFVIITGVPRSAAFMEGF